MATAKKAKPAATKPRAAPTPEPQPQSAEAAAQTSVTAPEPEPSLMNPPRPSKYSFSADYSGHNIPLYEQFLGHLKGQPCRVLEIGSFEGGSTTWLLDNILTHPDASIDTIDVWEQPRLMPNLAATGQMAKVKFHLGRSAEVLRTLPFDTYDFAIIDGAHSTLNVLEDMVHAFRLLKVGGIMETDDYLWDDPAWNQDGTPKAAVDAFMAIYDKKLKVLHKDWQVWLQKVADPFRGI